MEENMKTHAKNIFFTIFLCVSFIFTSCEGGIDIEIGNWSDDYREATYYLCNRVWTDEWYDNHDTYCYQELYFYSNNTGVDYLYTEDRFGNIQESTYHFTWDWWDSFYTSIRLDYGDSFAYMENIRMNRNHLDCILNGYPVSFIGR